MFLSLLLAFWEAKFSDEAWEVISERKEEEERTSEFPKRFALE